MTGKNICNVLYLSSNFRENKDDINRQNTRHINRVRESERQKEGGIYISL